MERDNIISQSFGFIINPMAFLGLYPPEKPSIFYFLRTYVMFIFLMVLMVPLTIANLINQKDTDFIELNFMCVFVTEVGFSALKLLHFFVRGQRLKKCINYFGQTRFAPKNKEEKKIVDRCVQLCQITCKIYCYGIIMALVLWVFPKLFANNGDLPVELWLPYDRDSSLLVFYSTYLFASIASAYCTFSSTMIDPMIGTLSYHATTQLKILKYNLKSLHTFFKEGSETAENENVTFGFKKFYKILKQCIEHHNDILYFVSEFEDCFSWVVFCQVAASTICLCFCCIGFTLVSPTSIHAVKFLLYYYVYVFQIFFYCFFGTLLFEENNEFMNAICEAPWYKYDNRIRKVIFIMMERSKRPMIITAGKIVELTFQTFISIIKASYSLFTVMKKFQ